MMKRSACVFAVALVASPAFAAPAQPEAMAPIRQFIEAMNKGDMTAAAAAHAPEAAIIDEVPPHVWRGFQPWITDLDADFKRNGMTNIHVDLGEPIRTEVGSDRGYVVAPAVFKFDQRGKPMTEKAQMTFALQKGADGWKISGWAWGGPRPQPAPAATPAKKKK
jgi:ketosteroid isomerase-like protein